MDLTFEQHKNIEYNNILRYLESLGDKVEKFKIINEDYSRCDLLLKIKGKRRPYMVEFKTRDILPSLYPDTLLEEDKIAGISKQAIELNIDNPILLFVVTFVDGSMYHFNMKKFDRKAQAWCPKHSSVDGNNEKVKKDCIYFNISEANKVI